MDLLCTPRKRVAKPGSDPQIAQIEQMSGTHKNIGSSLLSGGESFREAGQDTSGKGMWIAVDLEALVTRSDGSPRQPSIRNDPQIAQIEQMSGTHKKICGNLSHLRMTARPIRSE